MRIGLIGAGNMARALARGWGEPVLASDAGSGRAQSLADELGGEALGSNLEVARRADLIVLCHKPAQLRPIAEEIASERKPVVSVLAGTGVAALEAAYAGAAVFRVVPNTPVEVRQGVSLYASGTSVPAELEGEVVALFERLGSVLRLPEPVLDAAAAVSSVGPAYVALLVEAQVDAAIRSGLGAPIAGRLVAETMAGTATLLVKRDYDTLAVRREVASPGGTTARGLAALERAGVRTAFQDAMDAVRSWSTQ
ncbi:MAG TPA: pyrroline-5-carboxylate reductase [Solirubrobacteraceae bacterium]|nr:pyrroline-5-carboxylate reductase [Solirubrobacteraceae bacterium]